MDNRTIKSDREFILELTREFFNTAILEKIKDFKEFEVKGWEIWLQVEFYLFLFFFSKIKKVEREIRCAIDGRKNKLKSTAILDFMIHGKNKKAAIPLEIKQNMSATSCLNNMMKDVRKFQQIKYSGITTSRNLWCLGVHVGEIHGTVKTECPFEITSERIKNTDYFFTLI